MAALATGAVIAVCAAPLFGISAATTASPGVAAPRTAVPGGTWGPAEAVPNSIALNVGGYATTDSVSCGSEGNCAAGGEYRNGSFQAFVADERNDFWGNAEPVPHLAALGTGGFSNVNSVSCTTPGNCSAGGSYEDASQHSHAFVVDEKNKVWGNAEEVPGSAKLNAGHSAGIVSMSCTSAGNCAAVGTYSDASGHSQVFVVDERNGKWANAAEVPNFAKLNTGGSAVATSVSCATAGNCAAVGYYEDSSGHGQVFVVNETKAIWGSAIEIPNTGKLNAGGGAHAFSVSCAAAGYCSAGGFYSDSSFIEQAFIVNETKGVWGNAEEVPGTAKLNAGPQARVNSVSCSPGGGGSAGGYYTDGSRHLQAFVVNETKGVWGNAEEVPGTAMLNTGGYASIETLSCTSAGNCWAGGYYHDSTTLRGVLVKETNGTWVNAMAVPHLAVLSQGGPARLETLSCAAAGTCGAGGYYEEAEAFVVSYTPLSTVTSLTPVSGTHRGGTVVTVRGTHFVGSVKVLFGTRAGSRVTIVNTDEFKVTTPAGSGKVNVTVVTPAGTSTVSSKARFRYS